MAVLTPMIAANCTGLTPMASISGSSRGAMRMMAVTSLTIIPTKKSRKLIRISSSTLFWVMVNTPSTSAWGTSSMTKIWLSIRLKMIMTMMAPTAVAEFFAATRKVSRVSPL